MGWRVYNRTGGRSDPESGEAFLTFVQASALTVWTINHNWGRIPNIEISDSSGNKMGGEIAHSADRNTSTITFLAAYSGTATLS